MRTRLFVILTLITLAVVPGCNKNKDAEAPAAASAGVPGAAGALTTVPALLPDAVAKVNGVVVKKEELQMAITNLEGRAGAPVPAEQRDTVYRQVLDRIVGYHLLVQEARVRKFEAPPWDVDKRLSDIRSQFPSEQAFKDMLQQRGMTDERLRQETAETIAVNAMLEKEFESLVAISDDELRTFYDGNKPRFREEATVHASHILIRLEENADAAARTKARGQIEGIQAQVKKGANFAELARQHSQDPGSAPKGGDLGFFGRGQMVPAFEEAAFATKIGQVSGIVETPFGYHLIKVAETKPGRDVGFDEVKEQIREYLKQQVREQKSQAFIDQLKAKGKVEILI
ncbi:MAG: peptidylprolyl isomerase [Vicinamibacterales bacterium]|nr:peptidylprolyl isomerase [Vicinamibacterales bacterium]